MKAMGGYVLGERPKYAQNMRTYVQKYAQNMRNPKVMINPKIMVGSGTHVPPPINFVTKYDILIRKKC
jgi:hypothetical protein